MSNGDNILKVVNRTEISRRSAKLLKVVVSDFTKSQIMKPTITSHEPTSKNTANGYISDDENIRYKLNLKHLANNTSDSLEQPGRVDESNDIRYKFPDHAVPSKVSEKKKHKPKLKVKFWSNKQKVRTSNAKKEKSRLRNSINNKTLTPNKAKTSSSKVRKRVSFLPSPLFTDNQVPMVTVPDDLTIHLNEEEANDLFMSDDNYSDFNTFSDNNSANSSIEKKTPKNVPRQTNESSSYSSPRGNKRNHYGEPLPRVVSNESELEFFSKYVVQKLRRMETNQRIYSENLINTVLMLGQLGKLSVKSKVLDA